MSYTMLAAEENEINDNNKALLAKIEGARLGSHFVIIIDPCHNVRLYKTQKRRTEVHFH